jgi:hypothetical protein
MGSFLHSNPAAADAIPRPEQGQARRLPPVALRNALSFRPIPSYAEAAPGGSRGHGGEQEYFRVTDEAMA